MRVFAIALCFAVGSVAAAPTVESVRKNVYWLPGAFIPGRQPDGNSVLIRGKSGWIIVDTGRHAEHTQRILDFVRDSDTPIVDVVNTHWHLDHVSGNPMLKQIYPELSVHASVGIEHAMDGFLANYRRDLQTQIAATTDAGAKTAWQQEIARIDAGKALYPDAPVTESALRVLAGRKIAVNLTAHAVTEGDVWLYDRTTRTLVAGDLVTLPVPFLDTACPARWQEALATLSKSGFRTLIPGHGKPMGRSEFDDYRRGFDDLLICAAGDATIAECTGQWLRNLDELIPEAEQPFTRDLLEYYIGQVLRGDPRRTAKYCNS
jgi:glyoxylase-like metal-dependent hydrolase (beta-lactamase superfamily II)